MTEVFDPSLIDAAELGLSCDTDMASRVAELDPYTFLTNSDAHSLGKIGREYNEMLLKEANFTEFSLALKGKDGRKITANYGLNPKLGKYYRTACDQRAWLKKELPYVRSAGENNDKRGQ